MDAASFRGYPELVGQMLDLNVVNASCPGETTGSFIDITAQSNGCEANSDGVAAAGYRTNFPLHRDYSGSQLAYAKSFLTHHLKTTKLVRSSSAPTTGCCQKEKPNPARRPTRSGRSSQQIAANVAKIVKQLAARPATPARSSP